MVGVESPLLFSSVHWIFFPQFFAHFFQLNAAAANVYIYNKQTQYVIFNLNKGSNLAEDPEEYYLSSAKFYEKGIDDFGFLTHYMDKF